MGGIPDPLHRLAFTWTTERLRKTKQRKDVEDLLYAFHYDEVGHLERRNLRSAILNGDLYQFLGLWTLSESLDVQSMYACVFFKRQNLETSAHLIRQNHSFQV